MSWGQKFQHVCACFLTADLTKTAEYYRDVLGFRFDRYWGEPPCFVMLRRDDVEFFFTLVDGAARVHPNKTGPEGTIWDAYVRVAKVDKLFKEFKAKGAKILREPETAFYNMREFEVEDCNGYVLCFAQNVE